MSAPAPGRVIRDAAAHRVTTLELFFDLVFVYGLSQVTAFLARDPSPAGFGKGLLLLALLWWAWVAYSWLGTSLRITDGYVRTAVFAAMAAIMLVALAMPYWYDADRGASAALLATSAYVAVRIVHVVLYFLGARGHEGVQRAVRKLSVTVIIAAVLLIGGAYLGGTAQIALMAAALAIDLAGPLLGKGEGWVLAPAHFTERHGLIVIIALGESIVAIGVGAAGLALNAALVSVAVLGVALACLLWLAYFDATAERLEHALMRRTGLQQVTTARDVYSYLHFGLVAGLVLMALAVKSVLGYAAEKGLATHMADYAAASLGAGLAVYLLALWAMRVRCGVAAPAHELLLPVAAVMVIPLGMLLPAPAALGAALVIAGLAVRMQSRRAGSPSSAGSPSDGSAGR